MAESRFDEQGNEYRITEVPEDQCLVWTQMLDEDGESYDGELRLIQKVVLRDVPPRQKVESRIAEARITLNDLHYQIRACRQELKAFEDGADDRMAKLKAHKSLSRLDDFLAGRITHYVEEQFGPPKIVAFEDTKTDGASGSRDEMKLLTLFGCTNGELNWRLNRWSDGSGCNATVTPCTSLGEALRVAGEMFAVHETTALDPEDRRRPERRWATRAAELGIRMSDRYLEVLEAEEASAKQAAIVKLQLQLHKLQEKLATAEKPSDNAKLGAR